MSYLREQILDRDGRVIAQSRNLAGIRRYVGGHNAPVIKVLDITELAGGGGKLCILFENGASYETSFASFGVLREFVRRWRNVWGAPLTINGSSWGDVFGQHVALKSGYPSK